MWKSIAWFSFVSGRWIPEVQQTPAEQNLSKGDSNDGGGNQNNGDEDDHDNDDNIIFKGGSSEVFILLNHPKYGLLSKYEIYEKNIRWYEKLIAKGPSRMFKQKKTKSGTL